jgi:hypothetical protein
MWEKCGRFETIRLELGLVVKKSRVCLASAVDKVAGDAISVYACAHCDFSALPYNYTGSDKCPCYLT